MPTGHAIHIGLNSVDPDQYDGWDGQLNAPENDLQEMEDLTTDAGFGKKDILKGEAATRENVRNAIASAAQSLESDDLLVISYSGHGTRVPDLNGDERRDGKDDAWCLYDGLLFDDELEYHWYLFEKDVRIILISDSCHSGTMSRDSVLPRSFGNFVDLKVPRIMPTSVARRTIRESREKYTEIQLAAASAIETVRAEKGIDRPQCAVRLLAACMESQLAFEVGANGVFTEAIMQAWDEGKFRGSYQSFYRLVTALTPRYQTPQHRVDWNRLPAFDQQNPFQI